MNAIVNLAPTGMVPTKEQNASVPLAPHEIGADVAACAAVGMTSVHIHARDESGAPTWKKQVYARIIAEVRQRVPDVVITVSCSGRNWQDLDRRSEVLELEGDDKPDMATLTLSSLNFPQQASLNEPGIVRGLAERMRDHGIRPELEIFDLGMANYATYLVDHGVLSGPLYANLFFGNVSSAQATLLEMGVLINALPPRTIWSAAGIGPSQLRANAIAIAMGGGVRVGLEDNLWQDSLRTTAATNLSLLQRIHGLVALHDRAVMSPSEFRELLDLTARDATSRSPILAGARPVSRGGPTPHAAAPATAGASG